MLLQRIQVQFPGTTRQLSTIHNCSSSSAFFSPPWVPGAHMAYRHTGEQNTHAYKTNLQNLKDLFVMSCVTVCVHVCRVCTCHVYYCRVCRVWYACRVCDCVSCVCLVCVCVCLCVCVWCVPRVFATVNPWGSEENLLELVLFPSCNS